MAAGIEGVGDVPAAMYMVLRVILGLAATIGTFGNILTLCAIGTTKKLQTLQNTYLVNLAVVDTIVCSLLVPCTLLGYSGLIQEGTFLCQMVAYPNLICLMVSVMNLGMVAVNRYIMICKSRDLYSKIYTRRNVALSLVFMWTLPFFLLSPPLWFDDGTLGKYDYNHQLGACLFASGHPPTYFMVFICSDSLIIFPSLIGSLYCYISILRKFQESRKKVGAMNNTTTTNAENTNMQEPSTASSQPKKPVTKTAFQKTAPQNAASNRDSKAMGVIKNLMTIYITFLTCWLPMVVLYKVDYYGTFDKAVFHSLFVLAQCNSCLNFLIYAIMNQQMKDAYKRLLTCGRAGGSM